ncbi:MAG TPA: cytochrome P450 [Solirubrobacteraceae bacterium]|jgi:cytochrome P450|nr:cytochrome P450 [Solirubrobacteraceae bacterium]
MVLVTELELPQINTLDENLRGDVYRELMGAVEGHDGWLAQAPFGFITLDRESGEFFLRSREVMFPSMTLAVLFNVTEGPLHEEISKNLITRHGADHNRLRALVNPALAPRRADAYRPAIQAILAELMDQLSDALDGAERIEFVGRFAKPFTSRVIAHVLGAPREDAPKLHYWSNLIQRQFDPASLMDPAVLAEIEQGVVDCYAYIDALIESRRTEPADNLVTDLIGAEEAGEKLNHDELRNLIFSVLLGGVDTTQSQLGHTIRLLAQHPEQWRLLRERPRELAQAAADEALRYEPITPFTARMTTSELEHRGVTFPENTVVLVSAWHANRDGIENADAYDITAQGEGLRLLTFGAGIHYCVGANLARAELQEGLVMLAEALREVHLDGEPQYGTPSGIYGLDSLPLRFVR